MESKERFLKSDAFKGLDEDKRKLIIEFLESKKTDINDIIIFINRLNRESPLNGNQQKQLFEALSESLSSAEKKKILNIMEIVKAFS